LLFDTDLQTLTGHDPRALVQMSRSVEAILGEAAPAANGTETAPLLPPPLPPEVVVLLDRAREKVIKFVPDDDAEAIGSLADALEVAAGQGSYEAEKAALESALRRYAYLF
jgi:hypothetical protein